MIRRVPSLLKSRRDDSLSIHRLPYHDARGKGRETQPAVFTEPGDPSATMDF